MKRTRPQRPPNYLAKIAYLRRVGLLRLDVGVHELDIAHDDWCPHLKGKTCRCNPDIVPRWSQGAASRN